ncbi:hypothetical protein pv_148 [Pithovirus sibericum]|uniref:F-box domain-containing protein n=1 Tax=Pithovirus sibericum TaxID=1450746 RepID=W5SAD2_9VIRU|nr:hypothetical protein pv_148 [Pithovirus sibericum]AHH01715.1 hypothetical protein pv_148 [Pithovirus sibericum]
MSRFEELPPEALFSILSFLPYDQINLNSGPCSTPELSSACQEALDSNFFWFEKAEREFGVTPFFWDNTPYETPKDKYLYFLSSKDVVKGSQTFQSLEVCLKRAYAKGDPGLVQYFRTEMRIVRAPEPDSNKILLKVASRASGNPQQYQTQQFNIFLDPMGGWNFNKIISDKLLSQVIEGITMTKSDNLSLFKQVSEDFLIGVYFRTNPNSLGHSFIKVLSSGSIPLFSVFEEKYPSIVYQILTKSLLTNEFTPEIYAEVYSSGSIQFIEFMLNLFSSLVSEASDEERAIFHSKSILINSYALEGAYRSKNSQLIETLKEQDFLPHLAIVGAARTDNLEEFRLLFPQAVEAIGIERLVRKIAEPLFKGRSYKILSKLYPRIQDSNFVLRYFLPYCAKYNDVTMAHILITHFIEGKELRQVEAKEISEITYGDITSDETKLFRQVYQLASRRQFDRLAFRLYITGALYGMVDFE